MKVLLVNPPSRFWLFPPLGLAYIASAVKQNNHEVQILDMTAEPDRNLSDLVRSFSPDVVGLSCTSQTFQSALTVARQIKTVSKKIRVVFGGSHPSSIPNETLVHEEVDAVICGEGEIAFTEYLNQPFTKRVIQGKPMDINSIPVPSRDLLPMSKYETAGSILTSRGCPYQCNYCVHHVSGYKWRGRTPESVVQEIETLANQLHISDIHVVDDNFSFDIERAKRIFRMVIQKKLPVKFWFFNGLRADRVDQELLSLMKQANTCLISIGLESTNPQVRENIKKGVSLEQTANALKLVHSMGIRTRVSVMVGNVGDTYKSALKTIDWVRKNSDIDDAEFCLCTAYPNTPLHGWVQKNGTILANPEDQSTYFLDSGSPSFYTVDFPKQERIKALRTAQAMVYRKAAVKDKSIFNFKLSHLPTYINTAKFIILKKAPAKKFKSEINESMSS